MRPGPLVLCILDGWGHREDKNGNAISLAATPNYDLISSQSASAFLETSGLAVGLPEGQMGNSEVGHTNIGAGRVVLQNLPRIDKAIASGELSQNPALGDLIGGLRESGGQCHLMGLVSPGGVHSHQDHILALARELEGAGIKVAIHAFLDGRDTPPKSAQGYMRELEFGLNDCKSASVATVSGRYFAMDRDQRWERVERAYVAIVEARGETQPTAKEAIEAAYAAGQTDEFVEPVVIEGYRGMKDGDGILMANFRADRAREILSALLDPEFSGFNRAKTISFQSALGMTKYSTHLNRFLGTLFQPLPVTDCLGDVVSKAGLKQLRIAETEKYAHVTFFLNGGEERLFDGEERILVPSPRVATYDLQPEMSAIEVTDRLVEAIDQGRHDLIVVNYANPDMVGHTGRIDAAIQAIEAVDACLGRIREAVEKIAGTLIVTADHGNAEQMLAEETGKPHTAHTTTPVPILLYPAPVQALANGCLADIAPTILEIMGLRQPKSMTGNSLLKPAEATSPSQEQARASA